MNNTDYSLSRFLQNSMEYLNLDEKQFAELLGISVKDLNDFLFEYCVPTEDVIKNTCALLEIPVWVCNALTINPNKKRFHDGARIAAFDTFNKIRELFCNVNLSKTALSAFYCIISMNNKFKSRNDFNFTFN